MTARSRGRRIGPFIATKEHRRFTEFATTIRTVVYLPNADK